MALSTNFIFQSNEFGNEDVSELWEELEIKGCEIRRTGLLHLSAERLELAKKQIDMLESPPPKKVAFAVVVWVLPVIVVIIFFCVRRFLRN